MTYREPVQAAPPSEIRGPGDNLPPQPDNQNLPEAALNNSIVGREHLYVSDERLAEFRLRYLIRQSMLMAEQTTLMDAKASALMVVVLFFLSNAALSAGETVENQWLFILSTLVISFSLIFSLFVVVPRRIKRTSGEQERYTERFSWVGLSRPELRTEELIADLPTLNFPEMARQLQIANQAMAMTIRRKYIYSRLAFASAAIGFVAAAFAHDMMAFLENIF